MKIIEEEYIDMEYKEYSIYYLPAEHYVGVTVDLNRRLGEHKRSGKNVDRWCVLETSVCKKTAYKIERKYQVSMKANGLVTPTHFFKKNVK